MAPLIEEDILVVRYNGQQHCLDGCCHQAGECKLSFIHPLIISRNIQRFILAEV